MLKWTLSTCLGLLLNYFPVDAQQKVDGAFMIKMWLFLEKKNVDTASINSALIKRKFLAKGESLFEFFEKNINLRFDTVKSNGFQYNFVFLSVTMGNGSIKFYDSANAATDELTKSNLAWYLLIGGNCDRYIIGINVNTGVSYRLSGFDGNDLLTFIEDVKRGYYNEYHEKINTRTFFRKYSVEGLDLRCLYAGLISGDSYNSQKYPCLKRCSATSGLYLR